LSLKLKEEGFNVSYTELVSNFGHESWVIDGERFFNHVKNII